MKDQRKDMSRFLEEMSVSREQYCARMDGGIYKCYEDVPEEYRCALMPGYRGVKRDYDYPGLLAKGKAWLIEPLRDLQPHSFEAFESAVGPLLLGIVLIDDLLRPENSPLIKPVLFLDACGRMIEIEAMPAQSTYEGGNDCAGTLPSLPSALSKSWLWRTGGWRVPSDAFQGPLVNRRLIGHPNGGWLPIDQMLKSYDRRGWKKMMSSILERFPDAVVTKHNPHDGSPYHWTSMRCFLDTRPVDLGGPVGDQFFVFDQKRDQIVYHIHQGDVEGVRVLHNPEEAIDRYCAHVLLRQPGEFDFLPWGELIK